MALCCQLHAYLPSYLPGLLIGESRHLPPHPAPQTVGGSDLQEWVFSPLGPAFKNARIMKALLEDVRGTLPPLGLGAEQPEQARRVRCSAFNACAALVAATQTKAKFYAMPLEVWDGGGISGVGTVKKEILLHKICLPA